MGAEGSAGRSATQRDPLAGVRWIHGSPPGGPADPKVQVVHADDDTFILRQSKDLNYEGPFLYLLCGAERAILLDTGAVAGGGVRETVDSPAQEQGNGTRPATSWWWRTPTGTATTWPAMATSPGA